MHHLEYFIFLQRNTAKKNWSIATPPARELDPYRVSTPIGFFLRSNTSEKKCSIGLRSLVATEAVQSLGGTRKEKQRPQRCFSFLVPPLGIEPRFHPSQGCVLSIERRGVRLFLFLRSTKLPQNMRRVKCFAQDDLAYLAHFIKNRSCQKGCAEATRGVLSRGDIARGYREDRHGAPHRERV